MLSYLPFFPPQGSTHAASVDALYFFFVAVTAFFSVLIAMLIVVFAVRFRRRTRATRSARPSTARWCSSSPGRSSRSSSPW